MPRLDSPIIIIGAGRSGSSLLHELLNCHPAIDMLGEMEFAVPSMWRAVWEVSAAAGARSQRLEQARREVAAEPDDSVIAQVAAAEQRERESAAAILRETLDKLYRLAERPASQWGFKEIWMPSQGPYSWEAYDHVFPHATYVHIIRHPFHYARSVADWNRIPFTLDVLREQLTAWVDFLGASRQRQATGRYVDITYEALVHDPRAILTPLLERLALRWDDACLEAARQRHVPSVRQSHFPAGSRALADSIPNLRRHLADLGYDLDGVEEQTVAAPLSVTEVVTRLNGHTWRLNPPFAPDGRCGWLVPLRLVGELCLLAIAADDLANARRSPVLLYEDGQSLGPAHSLHDHIRHSGQGRYSHWALGHVLLFSSSDNSDPNTNGRTYTIGVEA